MGLTLAVPALALGGQHPPVILGAAGAAAGAALLLGAGFQRLPRPVWLFLALAGYTLLQLVPLPIAWVHALSPAAAQVWSEVLRPFGETGPGWVSLSIDPGATALEAVKWSAYSCVVLAAAGLRARQGAAPIAALVFALALLIAVVTLAHGALGAERIYGLYPPPDSSLRWTRGPIVNANTLAGLLVLGCFCGAGLWLEGWRRLPRWLPPIGVGLLAVGVVLTTSRAGIAVLLLGTLLFVPLALRLTRRDFFRWAAGASGLVLGGVVLFVSFWGRRGDGGVLDPTLGGKADVWVWSLDLISAYPIFGAGRGSFETAFPRYQGAFDNRLAHIAAHAENFPLEWTADWGLPIGIAALAAAAYLGRGLVAQAGRDGIALGIAVGLAMLLLQNFADLGLEIFAVAATAAAAYSVAERPRKLGEEGGQSRLYPIAVTGVAILVALATGANAVQLERREFSRKFDALESSSGPRSAEFSADLRSAMLRHPGEAYFPLLGAVVAARQPGGNPLVWLGRALELNPRYGRAHFALAEQLHRRGTVAQALLHLRLAAHHDAELSNASLARAARWARSAEELVRAFPPGGEGSYALRDACPLLASRARIDCYREVVRRTPSDADVTSELGFDLLDALEAQQDPCPAARSIACVAEVRALAQGRAHDSRDWRHALIAARLAAYGGDFNRAFSIMLADCPATREARPCLEKLLELAPRVDDPAQLTRATQRYTALACSSPHACAAAHEKIAERFAEHGNWAFSLRHYRQAVQEEPNARRWLLQAQAAVKSGASESARQALRQATVHGELNHREQELFASVESELARASP